MEITEVLTDPKLESEGVWIKYDEDTSFKIASSDAIQYERAVQDKLKPYRSAQRRGELDQEKARELAIEAIADSLLKDWKGVTRNGEPLPFNRDNAIMVLSRVRGVREFISNCASEAANFRARDIQDGAENLKKS